MVVIGEMCMWNSSAAVIVPVGRWQLCCSPVTGLVRVCCRLGWSGLLELGVSFVRNILIMFFRMLSDRNIGLPPCVAEVPRIVQCEVWG
jgi:hypothetical protein